MQYAVALLALAASVSGQTAPGAASAPSYCASDFSGTFEISPQNQTDSNGNAHVFQAGTPKTASCTTNPIISLNGGTLTDQQGRTAEVLSNNRQFQFDNPLQNQRAYSSGFEVCTDPSNSGNVTLAHGGNTTFYACNSGSFANLYDQSIGGQCYPVYIEVLACGSSSPNGGSATGASSAPATSATSSSTASLSTSMAPYVPSMSAVAATTPATTATASTAPYPVGNSTTPAASGSVSSTAPVSTTSAPITAPASGASTLSVGATFGAVAAAIAALAML